MIFTDNFQSSASKENTRSKNNYDKMTKISVSKSTCEH